MSIPVFIYGISGATWRVMDPLLAAGRLPHFASLLREGCRADLLSVLVPGDKHYRPQVAWASLATGCNPERHGITRFYHSADDLQVPSLWQLFERAGRTVGIYGWPLDWPPPATRGFVIPSHLARDTRTWPPHLYFIKALDREQQDAERNGRRTGASERARTVARLFRSGLRAQTLLDMAALIGRSRLSTNIEARTLLLRRAKLTLSTDLFLGLCERYRPDLRCFHTFYVDFVSHRFWRYHEPERFSAQSGGRFRTAVTDAYVHADRALGCILKSLPENALVAVLSEHGMQAELQSAEVGEWRYVIDPRRLSELIGLEKQIFGAPVARWIAYLPRVHGMPLVDAAARLRRIQVLQTGLPLFQVHEHGTGEVIVKFNIERAVPRYREGRLDELTVTFDDTRVPFSAITRRLGAARSAMHDERGILILRGPGVPRGVHLPEVRAIDVAPTLLNLAQVPLHAEMDGTALDWSGGHRAPVGPAVSVQMAEQRMSASYGSGRERSSAADRRP